MTEAPVPHRFLARLLPGDPLGTAIAIALDLLVVAAAYGAALLLRFDADIPGENWRFTVKVLPFIAAAYVAANLLFGVYRTMWTYGSVGDILALFRPVAMVTVGLFLGNAILRDRLLPLSVIIIAGALIFPGMAVVKMRARLLLRLPWGKDTA